MSTFPNWQQNAPSSQPGYLPMQNPDLSSIVNGFMPAINTYMQGLGPGTPYSGDGTSYLSGGGVGTNGDRSASSWQPNVRQGGYGGQFGGVGGLGDRSYLPGGPNDPNIPNNSIPPVGGPNWSQYNPQFTGGQTIPGGTAPSVAAVNNNAYSGPTYPQVGTPSTDPSVFGTSNPSYIQNLNAQGNIDAVTRANQNAYQNWLMTGAKGPQPQYATFDQNAFNQWWNSYVPGQDAPPQNFFGGSAGQSGNPFTSFLGKSDSSGLDFLNSSRYPTLPVPGTMGIQARPDLGIAGTGPQTTLFPKATGANLSPASSLGVSSANANANPNSSQGVNPIDRIGINSLGNTFYNPSNSLSGTGSSGLQNLLGIYAMLSLMGGNSPFGFGGNSSPSAANTQPASNPLAWLSMLLNGNANSSLGGK